MLSIGVDLKTDNPWPFALLNHNASQLGPRPDWRLLAEGKGKNVRSDWPTRVLLAHPAVSEEWRQVALYMTSPDAWRDFYLAIFADSIRREHPWLEERVGRPLEEWRTGIRGIAREADIFLDFMIGINTPTVDEETAIGGPHIDNPRDLIGGLLYMREEGDDAGGTFQVLRCDEPRFVGKNLVSPETPYRHILTVPYRNDNGFGFVQTKRSVHLLTARKPTDRPRLLLGFCAGLNFPLFEIPR